LGNISLKVGQIEKSEGSTLALPVGLMYCNWWFKAYFLGAKIAQQI